MLFVLLVGNYKKYIVKLLLMFSIKKSFHILSVIREAQDGSSSIFNLQLDITFINHKPYCLTSLFNYNFTYKVLIVEVAWHINKLD